MTVRRLALISMAALALLAAAFAALILSQTDASDALGLSEPLRPRLRAVEQASPAPAPATPPLAAPAGDDDVSPANDSAASTPAVDDETTAAAAAASEPEPLQPPPLTLPRSGTDAVHDHVDPPVLVEIPADLISTPTPLPNAQRSSLPMLTNIPSTPRDGSVVYLTFDDGPDPLYTNQILDLLARYNAKATFFVLGNSVNAYPGVVQRIANEGHALGNHTFGHEALPTLSNDEIANTLGAANAALQRVIGRGSSCLRPPYGALDQATFDQISGLGYTVHMWEVDSEDWKTNDSYAIAATVLSTTSLGNRVLFHDGPTNRASTVAALESVLEVLTNRGVQFHALAC